MSRGKVTKREIVQMWALADERAGIAGLLRCPGCPDPVLVPDGGEYDGMCPSHWHQTQFRYGIQGGVSHADL